VYLNPFYLKRYGTAVDERIGLCSKCSFFWLGNGTSVDYLTVVLTDSPREKYIFYR
jgi:hypothetical protein